MSISIVRVKRKRGDEPAESLIVSCKKIKCGKEDEDTFATPLFKFAATNDSIVSKARYFKHISVSVS